MGRLDFTLSYPVGAALLIALLFPFTLGLIARAPRLRGRNALQFLANFLCMTAAWGALVGMRSTPSGVYPTVLGGMLLAGAQLVYLEIWALISRGYTLGLLLTLLRAEKPLELDALANAYRGGEGLDWIMRHRVSGLVGAGLVHDRDGKLILTRVRGCTVAWLYRETVRILGLRRTG